MTLAEFSKNPKGILWRISAVLGEPRIRQVGGSPPQLELVLELQTLLDGPGANSASGNVTGLLYAG